MDRYLVLDIECKDPYIDRGLGSGWVYLYNKLPNCDYKVLGTAYRTHEGEEGYTTDLNKVQELVDDHTHIICHNLSYDLGGLRAAGIRGLKDKPALDTEVMGRLYDSSLMSHSLDALASKYLKLNKYNNKLTDAVYELDIYPYLQKELKARDKAEKSGEQWVRTRPDEGKLSRWCKGNMDIIQEHSLDTIAEYAIQDVSLTWELFEYFKDKVSMEIAYKYSMVTHICLDYRIRGVRVDLKRAREVRDSLVPLIKEYHDKCYGIVGYEFMINSSIDMAKAFDDVGIEYPKTAAGNPSITTPWMLQQTHPLCKAISDARKALKIDRDFVKKVLDIQEFTDYNSGQGDYGRVYPELHMLRARTGRFSCTGFNMQQIPSRDPVFGKMCREMFVPEDGEKWYAIDFCYSADTEVLTDSGFKLWSDVTSFDKLAQVKEGSISYADPMELIKIAYEGSMYHQEGNHVDLLVSPNHNLLLMKPSGEIVKKKADEGLPKGYRNIHAAVQEGSVDMDMRLQVAIDADGSIKKGLCTFYLKKSRKVSRLIELLGDTPYTIKTNLPSKPGYTAIYFRHDVKRFNRDDVLALTLNRRKEFLDELQYWDGSRGQYFTALESHALLVQEVAIKSGYRASISKTKGGYTGSNIYIVYYSPKSTTYTCRNKYTEVPYSGYIYCATMPHGTLVVRRNGKVVVGSNCNQEGRLQVHYASKLKCRGADELVKAFNKDPNLDMHQKVADMVGIGRREAKSINLGVSYGMGVNKLAEQLGVEIGKAKKILERYNTLAPYLKDLNDKCSKVLETRKVIRTIGGRLSRIDKPLMIDNRRVTFEYKALNKLIQGSAADQTIEAMIQAYAEGIPVLLPVHDELCMSGTREQADRLKQIMETAVPLVIPVVAELGEGSNWAEAH